MIVDIFRALAIGVKFVFFDAPKAVIIFLFFRQNQTLKDAFQRRVSTKKH